MCVFVCVSPAAGAPVCVRACVRACVCVFSASPAGKYMYVNSTVISFFRSMRLDAFFFFLFVLFLFFPMCFEHLVLISYFNLETRKYRFQKSIIIL